MSDRLQKMREKHGAVLAPLSPTVTTTAPPPKPTGHLVVQTKQVVGSEPVTHSCGHAGTLEHFPPNQDKFRDARRLKQQGKPCPECKAKLQTERQQAETSKPSKQPVRPMIPDRLPAQSQFVIEPYDAEAQTWTGYLKVPGFDPFGPLTRPGVFKLLRALDGLYRAEAAKTDRRQSDRDSPVSGVTTLGGMDRPGST